MNKALLFLGIVQVCAAQVCPPEWQPQVSSSYSYIRAEIKALRSVRQAEIEWDKIELPGSKDPRRFVKLVNFYAIAQTVTDDYDCALMILQSYKESKDNDIAKEAEDLIKGINYRKLLSAKLVSELDAVIKAKRPVEIDETAVAKSVADLKGAEKDVNKLIAFEVKGSTFGIIRVVGDEDDAKPVAFTITEKQRATLLREAQELRDEGGFHKSVYSYVDICAEVLLTTLKQHLPTAAAQ